MLVPPERLLAHHEWRKTNGEVLSNAIHRFVAAFPVDMMVQIYPRI